MADNKFQVDKSVMDLEVDETATELTTKPAEQESTTKEGENEESTEQQEKKVVDTEKKVEENSEDKEGQEEEENKDTEQESIISQLKKNFDLDFKDKDGKDLDFTIEGEEGLESVVQLTEFAANKLAEKRFSEVFEEYPEAYDLILHLKTGGTVEDFVANVLPDYSTIQIDTNNKEQQKNIYAEYLKVLGNPEDEIRDLLESAETKGTLLDKAKKSLEALTKYSSDQKQQSELKLAKQKQIQEQEAEQVKKEVKDKITSGKILNLEIDKKTQNEFNDFLFKPINKQGLTMSQKMDQEITLEQELYVKYLMFKGFKLGTDVKKVQQKLADLIPNKKSSAVLNGKENKDSVKNTNEPVRFDKIDFKQLQFDNDKV